MAQWFATPDQLRELDVLVVDEANLTEDRQRAQLYRLAQQYETRIIEVGDALQLRGVGVGSLFWRIHQLSGGPSLEDNRRQAHEDERAAIAAWRDGQFTEALQPWDRRGRFVTAESGKGERAAMLARWSAARGGAPDAFAELRGVLVLAATNESVGRLNDAAQQIRAQRAELGDVHPYQRRDRTYGRFAVNDFVMVRMNDRQRLWSAGDVVLNEIRDRITSIDADGAMRIQWQQHDAAGQSTLATATVDRDYVEAGGVELAYAMAVHKAEGLIVSEQWTGPDGHSHGAAAFFSAAGADDALMHVATSRHKTQLKSSSAAMRSKTTVLLLSAVHR